MGFAFNYILLPVFVLALVIFVHELGHFLMARHFKIKTPVFSVGFGREIFGFTDKSGTRWKFSIFPLGGYVVIDGNDSSPLSHRAWVAFAGPLANFIFTLVIMLCVSLVYGAPKTPPLVVSLNVNGGAYAAGVLPRDKIISLGGHDVPYYSEEIKDYVAQAHGNEIDAVIERGGVQRQILIPLREMNKTDDFGDVNRPKMMGIVFAGQNLKLSAINAVGGVVTEGNISLARQELIKNFDRHVIVNFGKGDDREDFYTYIDKELNKDLLTEGAKKYSSFVLWDDTSASFVPISLWQSFSDSFAMLYQVCKKTLGVLYQMIVGKKDTGDLGGVVAISSMTGDVAEHAKEVGLYYFFRLIAVLSVNIGFLNLFPLPVLDGGHLLFYGIEAIRGRPPSPKVKAYIYATSIMFIILLSLSVTIRDILDKLAG